MKTKDEILNSLAHCTGSEQYHKYMMGLILTDGTKLFAELCQCFWLLDILASVQRNKKVVGEDFQVLNIKRNGDKAVVTVEDGNNNVLYKQNIPYTDFPLDDYKLFAVAQGNGMSVVMLPSEY